MYMQKVFFLNNNDKPLGYSCDTSNKSIVFGFRSKEHVERLKRYIQYIPKEKKLVEELVPNRYLVRTRFNSEHELRDERLETLIRGYTLYHSAVTCSLNNLTLSLVDHIYDRDDGDIEILCIKARDINANGPIIDDDIRKYNLELLFNNS